MRYQRGGDIASGRAVLLVKLDLEEKLLGDDIEQNHTYQIVMASIGIPSFRIVVAHRWWVMTDYLSMTNISLV